MELVCRVMYDMQQDYFGYLLGVSQGLPTGVPDFSQVINKVTTHRAEALSPLPAPWYSLVSCPGYDSKPASRVPATAPEAMRTPASSAPVVNPKADARLLQRYKDGGYASITSMVGGRTLEYPKHNNKAVCMAWALKGSCAANCKRASQHVKYGAATVKVLHEFMDACGVANAQP
jgi:hypothetical protein